MPVNVPDKLPAIDILKKENIFVMDDLTVRCIRILASENHLFFKSDAHKR